MTDSINPFEVCAAEAFNVDDATITELARIGASGDAVTSRVGGTYLKVLVARSQDFATKADYPEQKAVDAVNAQIYRAVLAGVTTADCCDDTSLDRAERSRRSLERNRRSNFARTAVSTLRTWLSTVGKLEDLDPSLVTKAAMIEAINTARARARDTLAVTSTDATATSPLPLNDTEAAAARAYKRLYAALRRIKATDPARARHLSDKISSALIANFEEC